MSAPKSRLQEAREAIDAACCQHADDSDSARNIAHSALDAAVEEAINQASPLTARTLRDFANNPGGHFSNPDLEAAGRAIMRIVEQLAVEKARADAAEFQVKALLERSHDCNAAEKALAERTAELAAIRATLDVA